MTKLAEHKDIIPKQMGLTAEAVSSAPVDIPQRVRHVLEGAA